MSSRRPATGIRILIVDDDQVCAMLLSGLLKRYGDCQVATDGETAIRLFTKALFDGAPFDLVCLDILLPDLDGQSALRGLRAIESAFGRLGIAATTILMVTSQGDAKNAAAAFRGQCEGYVIKPITEISLVSQLARLGIRPEGAKQTMFDRHTGKQLAELDLESSNRRKPMILS